MLEGWGGLEISTHALREEGDKPGRSARWTTKPISTHALREEGDPADALVYAQCYKFLPTPSARRATGSC